MTERTYEGDELHLFARALNWKRYWASVLGPWIDGDVLEVGAGIGASTRALWTQRVNSWTCLEPDPRLVTSLRIAVERLAGAIPRRVLLGTTEDLGGDESFDAILYVDVLEHIEDDAGELRRAASMLREGGRLIVLAPAHTWLYSEFDRQIGHYRRYDRVSLAAATPPGLSGPRSYYLDSVGILLSLASRAFLRSGRPSDFQVQLWDRLLVPCSRAVDATLNHRLGKTIVAIWTRPVPR